LEAKVEALTAAVEQLTLVLTRLQPQVQPPPLLLTQATQQPLLAPPSPAAQP
jgi:hypothetical protein